MIVEVGVDGARDDEEFFVISFHLLVDVFAEVAGMGFFSMDEEDGCLDFIGVDIDRHAGEVREGAQCRTCGGVEGSRAVASLCLLQAITFPWPCGRQRRYPLL